MDRRGVSRIGLWGLMAIAVPAVALAESVPVVFQIDDAQDNNWENVTQAAFETHMDESVPMALGVIPCAHGSTTSESGDVTCLEDDDGSKFHDNYPTWIRNNHGMVEIVQHGATHHTNERLANFSKAKQREIMSIGLDRMATWGLPNGMPVSFNTPFASTNQDTVDVGGELNFEAFVKASRTFSLQSNDLKLIVHPVLMCERDADGNAVDGADCVFRSPSALVQEAQDRAQDLEDNNQNVVVVLLYHVQDLLISNVDGQEDVDPQKVEQLRQILQAFRQKQQDGTFSLTTYQGLGAGDSFMVGLGDSGAGWLEAMKPTAPHNHVAWPQVSWPAYNSSGGETRPALCDVDGDGNHEAVIGLGSNGGAGWFEVKDDEATGFAHLAWLRIGWSSYNSSNGETFPACGDLDGDDREEILLGLRRGSGGWLEVKDDLDAGLAHVSWPRLHWSSYNSSNGLTRPAVER